MRSFRAHGTGTPGYVCHARLEQPTADRSIFVAPSGLRQEDLLTPHGGPRGLNVEPGHRQPEEASCPNIPPRTPTRHGRLRPWGPSPFRALSNDLISRRRRRADLSGLGCSWAQPRHRPRPDPTRRCCAASRQGKPSNSERKAPTEVRSPRSALHAARIKPKTPHRNQRGKIVRTITHRF